MIQVLHPLPSRDHALLKSLRARMRASGSMNSTLRTVLVLLAAREVGQNVDRLARYTGLEPCFVSRCARRLIDNGVWHSGETSGDWLVEGVTHPGFWNDVAVAEGKLCRRTNERGVIEWAPPGCWRKDYDFITSEPLDELNVRYHASPAAEPESTETSGAEVVREAPAQETAAAEAEAAEQPASRSEESSERAEQAAHPRRLPLPARRQPPDPSSVEHRTVRPKLPELFPDAVWLR